MKTKNVLVINGHPDKNSFNEEIAQAYLKEMAHLGMETTYMPLRDLEFDSNLKYGYRLIGELEPDLVEAIELIKKSTHVVWIHPVWWLSFPALMKGFIDRTFLPDVAFKYIKGAEFIEPLLTGRSGRIITTGDGDEEMYERVFHKSGIVQLTIIMNATGFDPVLAKYIGPVIEKTREELNVYLNEVRDVAKEDFKMITNKA